MGYVCVSSPSTLPSLRISSILKPEQWDCDDWWRAAICLVPGFPIIMCQLNLTTVHYSSLRTLAYPWSLSLLFVSLSLYPPSFLFPLWFYLPRSYNCATKSATTIIRIAIQLPFNIIGARLKSSCLCGNVARPHYKTTKNSRWQINASGLVASLSHIRRCQEPFAHHGSRHRYQME